MPNEVVPAPKASPKHGVRVNKYHIDIRSAQAVSGVEPGVRSLARYPLRHKPVYEPACNVEIPKPGYMLKHLIKCRFLAIYRMNRQLKTPTNKAIYADNDR